MKPTPRPISAVTVYCASSAEVDAVYLQTAFEVGSAIARRGWTLVYGGNAVGCMQQVADGARSVGGHVVGITPRLFIDRGHHDTQAHELIVTSDMRERKLLLEQRGDAFLILPGGLGTYEELFEQLVNRQLRSHAKPLVALNLGGYFSPLREMIRHGVEQRFIKPASLALLTYADTVDAAIEALTLPVEAPGNASHELTGGR